jgi:hypothetical protein
MMKTLQAWIETVSARDREALEDYAENNNRNLEYSAEEITAWLLVWNGYGMSTNRVRELAALLNEGV